ncbi:hypothetical protein SMU76_03150 [Streptococcus mutans N66]|uniref:Rgg/GadR/MutR family transcriptional regulator n=1 Tax=Streptococcus mutans TaxID=1309 RepID=UPI0002B53A6F|nr:Rgg/GadR/MutR family transcriptional regulator [Streptococcus mutans]EMC15120.1 hypothetical protein SMU76_03150 [Streptococcus mutans N66]
MELGELYRELRIARGLKIKDIACDNLSKSQLSRFENGQTMLAADKLLLAISGIHMSFSEFGYALSHYEESDFFKIGHKLSELYVRQDIEGLKKLLEINDEYEVFDVYNRLNKLVIKVSIHSLDADYIISDDDKNFLTTYLYSIEEWTEYELYIFGNTMSILSSDDLIFLGKAFVERDKLYIYLPSHKKNAELVFLNLILLLIERKKLYQAIYFVENLEKLLNYQDMFATTFLKFFKKIIAYLQEKSIDISELERYVDIVGEINPTIATILKSNLNQLLSNCNH